MSQPLPNSPIDLRALVLYDIYQWKTTENSYKNYEQLWETIGEETISYDKYEYLHNEYLKESHYAEKNENDLPIPDIRICILSDVTNEKSAEKSINDLCDAFGISIIDKEDHDYWYKRFENEQIFTRITFSDLPNEIIAEIVGKCNLELCLPLRNVSYRLQTIVDQTPPACAEIHVKCDDEFVEIVPKKLFSIHSILSGCCMTIRSTQMILKLTNKGLERLLQNPKLRLNSFGFSVDTGARPFQMLDKSGYKKQFFEILNSLNHKIHVEHCSIFTKNEEDLVKILKCLKPGILETLHICDGFLKDDINEWPTINEIIEMDQWKQAKHLKLRRFHLPSIEHLLHFTTIETDFQRFSEEDYIRLFDGFSKSTNFEFFTMRTHLWDVKTIVRVLNLRGISGVHHCPGSNLVVEFMLESTVLELRKNIV